MNTEKRRGGYLATAEGVKQLKEAKRLKKYTYEQIKNAAQVTIDQVKRLFNPQWANGKYKIGEEAVSLICGVLELKPEEIVSDWYALEIQANDAELNQVETTDAETPYDQALQLIEQATREEAAELDLSGMELTELPSEIGQLTNLTELDLGGNSLSSLPPEIGQLTNLTELDLDGNSLPIPPEVIAKYYEPNTIFNYYFSLQSNQQKPLHEAKMLLVGQGNVGKTCVKERLIRNKYDPRRNKTDGIDIEPWEVEINQCQYQINVWDFGGQEIMHSTHQFFLTKRSLYLLVIDTTLGEEENRIEYWLKIIQSFGKDSPVIIVGNKADQHPLDIDKRGLQNKYQIPAD